MSKSTLRRLGRQMDDEQALEFLRVWFPVVAKLEAVAEAAKEIRSQMERANETWQLAGEYELDFAKLFTALAALESEE